MSENLKWKKILGKKWTFPAIYIIAATLILALMWWNQDPNEYPLTKDELGLEEINPTTTGTSVQDELLAEKLGEAIAVNNTVEQMTWPVENVNGIQVNMEFFDETAADEEMEKAIVSFQNELWPHTGIDFVSSSGEAFSVAAALGGDVVRAEKDPVVGYVVEISHDNGLVTSYSSLSDLEVAKGDQIEQGTVLGKASRNIFEKDQGIHLHFEVRKDGVVVNPNLFFDQDLNQVLQQLTE